MPDSNLPAQRGGSSVSGQELAGLRCTPRPLGLDIPEDLSFEEWEHDLNLVLWLHAWTPWALADLLNFGERTYGETYAQASKITGRAVKTLYNVSYLGREFPKEEGLRSEVLTPGHHAVLAGYDEDDKRYWLKEGERLERESNGHLSVRAFAEHVREHRREYEGARVERSAPPRKCPECVGTGRCPHCHGSGSVGEVPVERRM